MSSLEVAGPVILMTATIRARLDLPGQVLADPAVRRSAYAGNLRYWLTSGLGLRAVVFAENSSEPLGDLEELTGGLASSIPVEFLSLPCEFPGEFGKGFGEALLIEAALGASRVLGPGVRVAKVTGLQRVCNLKPLLRSIPSDIRLAVDLREHQFYRRFRGGVAAKGSDTRCFFFETEFYRERVAGLWQGHAKGQFYIEDALYRVAKPLAGQPGVQLRFATEPRYGGLAGHWGKDYDSASQRLKWLARFTLRKLAPRLWI